MRTAEKRGKEFTGHVRLVGNNLFHSSEALLSPSLSTDWASGSTIGLSFMVISTARMHQGGGVPCKQRALVLIGIAVLSLLCFLPHPQDLRILFEARVPDFRQETELLKRTIFTNKWKRKLRAREERQFRCRHRNH